jgi:hypothetical protein
MNYFGSVILAAATLAATSALTEPAGALKK